MGNPEKDTEEYEKKLEKTRLRKARQRLGALAKKPAVAKLLRKAREETAKKVRAPALKTAEAATLKANKHWRQNHELQKQVAALEAKEERLTATVANLKAKNKALEEKVADEKAKHYRNKLWWGWVEAFAKPQTHAWLLKLWKDGPPRARDGRRGGGQ